MGGLKVPLGRGGTVDMAVEWEGVEASRKGGTGKQDKGAG